MSSKLQRLFVTSKLAPGADGRAGKDQAHYLGNVLRLKPGDALLLFNGRTASGAPSLRAIGKKGARSPPRRIRPARKTRAPTCIICSRR